jgi:hypothetical protein
VAAWQNSRCTGAAALTWINPSGCRAHS